MVLPGPYAKYIMKNLEVVPADLPVKVDSGEPYYAIGRIFADNGGIRGASLFTLINPVVRLDTYSSTYTLGQVQVVHPSLMDSDNAFIRLGYFEFDSLQFLHAYDSIYKYRGWLTRAKAYDLETAKRMVLAVNEEGADYNYLPPDVLIRGYDLPFPVDVEICYSTDSILHDWLRIIET